MSNQDNPANNASTRPPLADLKESAKPNALQNFRNYVGFGFAGNTATAIVITNAVKKFAPGFVDKWSQSYEKKYIARKESELITPYESTLNEEAKTAIREKIAADAKDYGHKTVESRLLATGGFLMLPFQSAAEVSDYSKNMKGIVEPYKEAHGLDALKDEIGKQMNTAVANKDSKAQEVLANALEKPKFSPLGPSASKGLPKWITGRVIALGSAFTVQKFVDDRLGKQKDAIDHTIARIVTRITGGGKSAANDTAKDGAENNAFAQDEAVSADSKDGINPKILNTVRMITTDAYMTAVALTTQKFSVDTWDKKAPQAKQGIASLVQKFSGNREQSL